MNKPNKIFTDWKSDESSSMAKLKEAKSSRSDAKKSSDKKNAKTSSYKK